MFDLRGMIPGSRYTRSLTVRNNGTLDASWQLDATTLGDTTFLRHVRLSVDEVRHGARRRVFAGPIAALQRIDLGDVDPGDSRTYVFSARLPRGAEDPPGAAKVDFRWTATGVYR